MNRIQAKVKTALTSKGLIQGDLARQMSIDQSTLSRMLKSNNMQMSTAFLINDCLVELTGQSLTLEDFRKHE